MKKLTQQEADAIKVLPSGKRTLLRVTFFVCNFNCCKFGLYIYL